MDQREVLAWLERQGSPRHLKGLARYGIVAPRAYGVPIGTLLQFAKRHGKDHALSLALWDSGWYEARLLAAMVGDPQRVTRTQMKAWAAGFDSWAICDTVCWHLFDKTPFAWETVGKWSASPHEFVKRAAFAMMAGQAGHDATAADARFVALLPLIEKGARDERNFVKKAVSWALRRIGRRNVALHEAALAVARRLATSPDAPARWVGRDALRDLDSPKVRARMAGKSKAGSARRKT
jgi:3-methyladenine DNA glycosylase AlkD